MRAAGTPTCSPLQSMRAANRGRGAGISRVSFTCDLFFFPLFFPREERHLRFVDPSLPLPSLARGPLDWEEEGASEAEIEVEG